MSNKTTNQSGGGGDKPKRIDQYMGGKQKVPKPKKMSEADVITAASAVISTVVKASFPFVKRKLSGSSASGNSITLTSIPAS